MSAAVSRTAFRILTKKHGLCIKADAMKLLTETLREIPPAEIPGTMEFVASALLKLQTKGGLVSTGLLQQALDAIFKKIEVLAAIESETAENTATGMDETTMTMQDLDSAIGGGMVGEAHHQVGKEVNLSRKAVNYIEVINSFDVPEYVWRHDSKAFVENKADRSILGSANARSHALRQRYNILLQRLLRNKAFQKKSFLSEAKHTQYEITPIKQLHGQRPNSSFLLFGMLTQIEEGCLHLEDPDELIELIMHENVPRGLGLYTMNSFVLVEGFYTDDKKFYVESIAMPLFEERKKTLGTFGHSGNFFGGPLGIVDSKELIAAEKSFTSANIVVLSEVHLDNPDTLVGLRNMFEKFANDDEKRPVCYIFCGNFMSTPYVYGSSFMDSMGMNTVLSKDTYKKAFDNLADILAEFPEFSKRNEDAPAMIFVPGPSDPWSGNVLPATPIPQDITERLTRKIANVTFASNPCRVRCFSQEIVILRADMMNKMLRNSVLRPTRPKKKDSGKSRSDSATMILDESAGEEDTNDKDKEADQEESTTDFSGTTASIEEHLVNTVLEQAHLCPLPPDVQPISWAYDSSMRLYPPPHNVIIADQCKSYVRHYKGSTVCNPSDFRAKGGHNYMTYSLSEKKWQSSTI